MEKKLRADKVGQFRTAYEKNKAKVLATQCICGICGQLVDKTIKYPHPLSATVDHIIPIARGGHPSDITNLQLAHRWCNRQKSDKLYTKERKTNDVADIGNDDLPLHVDWMRYGGRYSLG